MSGTVSLRITLRYQDLEEFVSRYAENISSAGLFLRTRTPKPTGTRIRFELLLVDGARALVGEGVVVAVRHDDKPGMALRFHTLEPESRAVVDRVVGAHGEGALAPTPLGGALARPGAGTFTGGWKSGAASWGGGTPSVRPSAAPSSGGLLPSAGSWARRPAGEATSERPAPAGERKPGEAGSGAPSGAATAGSSTGASGSASTVPGTGGTTPSGRPRRRGSSVLRPWATDDEGSPATEIVRPMDPLAPPATARAPEGPLDEATTRIPLPATSPWSTPPTRGSAPPPTDAPRVEESPAWPVELRGTDEARPLEPVAPEPVVDALDEAALGAQTEAPRAQAVNTEEVMVRGVVEAWPRSAFEPSPEPPTTAMVMRFDEEPASGVDAALPSSIDVDLGSLIAPSLEVPEPSDITALPAPAAPPLAEASWASEVGPATVRPTPLDALPGDDDDHLRPIEAWRVSGASTVVRDESGAAEAPIARDVDVSSVAVDEAALAEFARSSQVIMATPVAGDATVEAAAWSRGTEVVDQARVRVEAELVSDEATVEAATWSGGEARAFAPPAIDALPEAAASLSIQGPAAGRADALAQEEEVHGDALADGAHGDALADGAHGDALADALRGSDAVSLAEVRADGVASDDGASESDPELAETQAAVAEAGEVAPVEAGSVAADAPAANLVTTDRAGSDEASSGDFVGDASSAESGVEVADAAEPGGAERAAAEQAAAAQAAADQAAAEQVAAAQAAAEQAAAEQAAAERAAADQAAAEQAAAEQAAAEQAAAEQAAADQAAAERAAAEQAAAEQAAAEQAAAEQAAAAQAAAEQAAAEQAAAEQAAAEQAAAEQAAAEQAAAEQAAAEQAAAAQAAAAQAAAAQAAAEQAAAEQAAAPAPADAAPATEQDDADHFASYVTPVDPGSDASTVDAADEPAQPVDLAPELDAARLEPAATTVDAPATPGLFADVVAEPIGTAQAVASSPVAASARGVALDVRAIDDGEAVLAAPEAGNGGAFVDDAFSDALDERDREAAAARPPPAQAPAVDVDDVIARHSTGRAARTGELVIEPTIRLDVPAPDREDRLRTHVVVDPALDAEAPRAIRDELATQQIPAGLLASEPGTVRVETRNLDLDAPTGRLPIGELAARSGASTLTDRTDTPPPTAPAATSPFDAPAAGGSLRPEPLAQRSPFDEQTEGALVRSATPPAPSPRAEAPAPARAASPFDEQTEAALVRDAEPLPRDPTPPLRTAAVIAPLPRDPTPPLQAAPADSASAPAPARRPSPFDEQTEAELRSGPPLPPAVIPPAPGGVPPTDVVRPSRLAASTDVVRPSAPPPSQADAPAAAGLLAPAPLAGEARPRGPASTSEAKAPTSGVRRGMVEVRSGAHADVSVGKVTVTGVASDTRPETAVRVAASSPGAEEREAPPAPASDGGEPSQFVALDLSDRIAKSGTLERGRFAAAKTSAGPRIALGSDGTLLTGADADARARSKPDAAARVRGLLLSLAGVSSEVAVEEGAGRKVVRLDGEAVEASEALRVCLAPLVEGLPRSGPKLRAVVVPPAPLPADAEALLGQTLRSLGIEVLEVVPAPVVAARAFGLDAQPIESALVVEVAEEHLTISVLRRARDGLRAATVRPLEGPSLLDFDRAIFELARAELERTTGTAVDAGLERAMVAGLEKLRADLRKENIVELRARDATVRLPRLKIYQATEGLVGRIAQLVRETLGEAGVHPRAVGAVVLTGVGGMLAPVGQALAALTTHEPLSGLEPTEVVAMGCVRVADGYAARERTTRAEVLELDVGIGLPGGRFHPLVAAGARLPAKVSRKHATTRDGQTEVALSFYEGRGEQVARCTELGAVTIEDLPKEARGQVQVEVELLLDEDAVLIVEMLEPKSGVKKKLTVATAQTPAARRQSLEGRPAVEDVGAAPKPKAKVGFFGRLLGRS